MDTKKVLFIDLETTGLDPTVHEVLEIGAVLYESLETMQELGRFERKIIPTRIEKAHPKALEVNRYDPEEWKREAVPLALALDAFAKWVLSIIGDGYRVLPGGHNVKFDLEFLAAASKESGFPLPPMDYHCLDTVAFSCVLMAEGNLESLGLHALAEFFGIEQVDAHRALEDAAVAGECARLFMVMMRHRDERLGSVTKSLIESTSSARQALDKAHGMTVGLRELTGLLEEIV